MGSSNNPESEGKSLSNGLICTSNCLSKALLHMSMKINITAKELVFSDFGWSNVGAE
jgi:hypothetical protein